MTAQRSRAAAALLGVTAGLILALNDVGSTLAYLQTIPQGFQGLPRPANLDWIAAWAGPARALGSLSSLLGLLMQLALLGLALVVFRTLNPEFRLTTPVPPGSESGAVLRQPIDRRRLRQGGAAALVSLWLLGYIGAWLPEGRSALGGLLLAGPTALERLWPGARAAASIGGLALLLGGLWLVWGEAGLLRPAVRGERRLSLRRALATAVLAGLALTPFALPVAPSAQEIATEVLQGMGGAARETWLTYLGSVFFVYPLALGAAGWTAASLARWSHFPRERRALAAGAAVSAVAWLGVASLHHLAGAGRFDYGVPLSRAAGVPADPAGSLVTLTLLPGPRPVVGVTPLVSDVGLTATEASARRVGSYLERRRFRTVHLFRAVTHECQGEALAWDSDQFLETALRSLERNPHPGICRLLVEKLAHSAATPTARKALARLHDPRRFHLPRETAAALAPLQRRLGSAGTEIHGRLRLNGRSARGTRVGLIEEALWQQLRGSPDALAHRLVVARGEVGRRGAFRLRQVPPGRYLLLVGLPPGRLPQAPFQVAVRDSPGPIVVAPGARELDVGTVRLLMAWAPPPGPIQQARAGS